MIVLFTDFGLEGPYIGQMKAVLARHAPNVPVIDLFADVPRFSSWAGAYLLAAYAEEFPAGTLFLAVVDPGVGTATRKPVIVKADGRWFVGPDNGLFQVVLQRAATTCVYEILWKPEKLSASFHGRDLFAPVTAQLACGIMPPVNVLDERREPWPDDLAEIVYIDHFGNAMTGLRAKCLGEQTTLRVHGQSIPRARTFGDVPPGSWFWYENANGLAEIAVNQGRVDAILNLKIGDTVDLL